MKIIPVIDILDGVVVHAVEGKRSEYQPLKSKLCMSAEPVAVALALKNWGFADMYVADLDAIMGKSNNDPILQRMGQAGLRLMVDAGTSDLPHARSLLDLGVAKVVVGTETLTDLRFVEKAVAELGRDRIVVSLDLKAGKVLSKSGKAVAMTPLSLASELQRLGASELIVLDLARVGSGLGPDFGLLQKLTHTLKVKLLVGGGARDIQDLQKLKNLGVYGVLMSTALHSGKVSVELLREEGLMD
jgi:phosphoribosylformimino-5-aminoimidazole carboxamide ribotide isomerase